MKRMCSSTLDIISNLPDNILEKILVLMPIRDAVRTSVLSKKWRDNWRTIPELAFDDRSIVDPYPILFRQILPPDQLSAKRFLASIYQLSIKNRFLASTYHVLLLHRGSILKFILSISKLESCSEIDTLITILSGRGIQELTLKIWKGDHQKLPQSLFSCQQLTHLNLQSCVFRPPTTFKGFNWVVHMELCEVIITADTFQTLVSSCPLLEQLKFESSACFDFIGIDASNLKVLSLTGFFKSLCFMNAPHLANFSLHPKAFTGRLVRRDAQEWDALLDGLPVLENLCMGSPYVLLLVAGCLLKNRLLTLRHLTALELSSVDFGVEDVFRFIWMTMTNSPKLQKVTIEVNSTGRGEEGAVKFCEENMGSSKFCLKHLREVEMRLVSGTTSELHIMKLLLAYSPILEIMVVKPHPAKVTDGGLRILKELSQFQRLSPKAKITYEHPNVRN
ncbi:hypothetical protein RHGRI_033722 [Rhododendron griersonianum]|uniref:F-box domain-containing protein n=1 Tax=Rhododendron griersonianum TaxID=479676 RepID=A0AAV6I282_9ERIC|nr:hypothetical protein RHGRI_033722 [Rhododendron griersonianum]